MKPMFATGKINRRIALLATLIVAGELVCTQHTLAQATGYLVTDLSGNDSTQVLSRLNNLGDVVGRAVGGVEGQTQATFWSHSGLRKKLLGVFAAGDYSSASAINDIGEVAGASNTAKGIVPFLWTAKGGLKRVPLLSGDSCGQAASINRYGHVVGYSSGQSGTRAFLWARSGGLRRLGPLPGGNYSKARDVNDGDEVAGTSGSGAGNRAVLWTNTGTVADLGTLPGDYASEAMAINNDGDVVGYSNGPHGMRAFLWTKTAGIQDLGVLPGGDSSRALAISDSGEVVGSSNSASGDHAFIWTKQTGMVDLNSATSANLGVMLIEAHAINSKGQIIVMGRDMHEGDMDSAPGSGDNQYCAVAPPATFLLTPTTTP